MAEAGDRKLYSSFTSAWKKYITQVRGWQAAVRFTNYLNSWCRARETQTKENSQFQATLISCAGNSDAHLFLLLLAILGRTDKLAEVVSRTYSIFSLLLAKAWLFFHLEWPSAPSSAADTFPIQHSETKTSFYLFYTAKFHPFFTRPVTFSFYFWIYSLSCTQSSGSTYQIAANQ